jgi:hypothetical protein
VEQGPGHETAGIVSLGARACGGEEAVPRAAHRPEEFHDGAIRYPDDVAVRDWMARGCGLVSGAFGRRRVTRELSRCERRMACGERLLDGNGILGREGSAVRWTLSFCLRLHLFGSCSTNRPRELWLVLESVVEIRWSWTLSRIERYVISAGLIRRLEKLHCSF